jgi:hypothetical protein
MNQSTWSTLKRVVDSPDFQGNPAFHKALEVALKKALTPLADNLWKENRELITSEWITRTGRELGIKPKGGSNRRYAFQDLALRLYAAGKQDEFFERLGLLRKERERELENRRRAKEIYRKIFKGKQTRKVFTEQWLINTCQKLGLSVGTSRQKLFEEALTQVLGAGLEDRFLALVGSRQKRSAPPVAPTADQTEHFQEVYGKVCGKDVAEILPILEKHFPEADDFENNFKLFLRQFGIQAGRSKKRLLWFRKVAEELAAHHTAGRFID